MNEIPSEGLPSVLPARRLAHKHRMSGGDCGGFSLSFRRAVPGGVGNEKGH